MTKNGEMQSSELTASHLSLVHFQTYAGKVKKDTTVSRPVIRHFQGLTNNLNVIPATPITASKSYNLLPTEPKLSQEPLIPRATSNLSEVVSCLQKSKKCDSNRESRPLSSYFDVLYYYGDRSKDEIPKSEVQVATREDFPAMHHVALIPLSFAQSRRDIRTRNEGFEMKSNVSQSLTPSLSHNLIPLQTAQAREDIRCRREGFETWSNKRRLENTLHHEDLTDSAPANIEDVPTTPWICTVIDEVPVSSSSTSSSSTYSHYSCNVSDWAMGPALQASPESAKSLFGPLDHCGIPPISGSDSVRGGRTGGGLMRSASSFNNMIYTGGKRCVKYRLRDGT